MITSNYIFIRILSKDSEVLVGSSSFQNMICSLLNYEKGKGILFAGTFSKKIKGLKKKK